MKVTVNFLPPVEAIVARVVLIFLLAGLILLLSALAMAGSWLQVRAEIPELREQLLDLGSNQNGFDAGNKASRTVAELNDIRLRIQRLKSLMPEPGRNVSQILVAMENVMPGGVRVKSLSYRQGEDAVVLEIEAADASFLQVLEKGNPFAHMTLIKQSKPEKNAQMLYEIRLTGG